MVTKREFERIAKAAFRAMPTLYHRSDKLECSVEPGDLYVVDYSSPRFSEKRDFTHYTTRIDLENRKILDANLHVCSKYEGRGFGREIVKAKEKLLRENWHRLRPTVPR